MYGQEGADDAVSQISKASNASETYNKVKNLLAGIFDPAN